MKTVTEYTNNLFNSPDKKWVAPTAVLVAITLIAGVLYYGGYLDKLLSGAKASDIHTWDFSDPADYNTNDGITIGNDYVTVDPIFIPLLIAGLPASITQVTDLWQNNPIGVKAAATGTNYIAFSPQLTNDWSLYTLPGDISVTKLVDSGTFGYVFGLGSDSLGNAAGVLAETSLTGLQNPQPFVFDSTDNVSAINTGISFKNFLYAGMTKKNTNQGNGIFYIPDSNPLDLSLSGWIDLNGVSSVNTFLNFNNSRLYAGVSQSNSNGSKIWYTDNGAWTEANIIGESPNYTTITKLIQDSEGYIYATTDSRYILKSTTPGIADSFVEIDLTSIIPSDVQISYATIDFNNNILIALTNGRFLRSVDYQPGFGANHLFLVDTGIDMSGEPVGSVLRLQDAISLPNGQIIWGGGWATSDSTPTVKLAAYASSTLHLPYASFINSVGVDFYDLTDITFTIPSIVSNEEFKYRISDKSSSNQWYYFDTAISQWVESTNMDETNTGDELKANIGSFTTQISNPNTRVFYIQGIFSQPATDLKTYDVVLDTIQLDYIAPAPTFVIEVEPFIEVGEAFTFTVTAQDPGGNPITDFTPTTPVVLKSNLMGAVPPVWEDPDDGELLGCAADLGWVNGVLTYAGCHVDTYNHTTDRWLGVGYYDTDLEKVIYGYNTTRIVDPKVAPLDHFVIVVPDLFITENTDFTIQASAHISPDLGGFIKPNYLGIPDVIADGPDTNKDDDGVLTPNVIGDTNTGGSFDSNNGIVSFDGYQISVADIYLLTVRDLSIPATGSTNIVILPSAPLPPTVTSVIPAFGKTSGDDLVNITGTGFIDGVGLSVFFDGTPATNVNYASDVLLTAITPAHAEGLVDVRVTNPDTLFGTLADGFDYTNNPFITNLNPDNGPASGGTLIEITGGNLGNNAGYVTFKIGTAGQSAPIVYWSDTLIQALTPANPANTTYNVIVQTEADLFSNALTYTYTDDSLVSKAVNYYSPEYNIGQMFSLDDIFINADGYSDQYLGNEKVEIAIGLFDDAGAPVVIGNDGLGTGYTVLSHSEAGLANDLGVLSQDSGFKDATTVHFRIFMYDPDINDITGLLDNPWVESIMLDYTSASGDIGNIIFNSTTETEPYEKHVPNDSITPIVYKMIATYEFDPSGASVEDPTFANVILGVNWLNNPQLPPENEFHAWIIVPDDPSNQAAGDNIIESFGPGDVIEFNVFFSNEGPDGNPIVFDTDAFNFEITGRVQNYPGIILIPSSQGTITVGAIGNISFADTETPPYEKHVPNDSTTPISFDMVATYDLGIDDPTFNNVVLGKNWLNDPQLPPEEEFHFWIIVDSAYGLNNIIDSFGPGDVVPFKVFFSNEDPDGNPIVFDTDAFNFEITGYLQDSPTVTLTTSPEGTVTVGAIGDISFADTETPPYEKHVSNNSNVPISFDMVATYGLSANDPTFNNVVLGKNWLNDPQLPPEEEFHFWIIVDSAYGLNNIIDSFGPGDVVPFKVFFSNEDPDGNPVAFAEDAFSFEITGYLQDSPTVTLTTSPEGIVTVGGMGAITFNSDTETPPYEKHVPNNSITPISYKMVATSYEATGTTPYENVILGINWLDNPQLPPGNEFHAWIIVPDDPSNQAAGDNIIESFGPGDVIEFNVFFSNEGPDGNPVPFNQDSFNFEITGTVSGSSDVTLIPSPQGTVTVGTEGDFALSLDESDLITNPDGTLTYTISATAVGNFDTTNNIVLTTDITQLHGSDVDSTQTNFSADLLQVGNDSVLTVKILPDPVNTDQWLDFVITGTFEGIEHILNASLYISTTDVEDFELIITDADKTTQANSQVIYDINVIYHPLFTDDITLTTNIETIFTDVTAEFDTNVLINGDPDVVLTVTIGENPTPLDVLTNFAITGTSGVIVHDATPVPSFTITSPAVDDVTLNITLLLDEVLFKQIEYCVDPIVITCDDFADSFVFNIYETGATDPDTDLIIKLTDLRIVVDDAFFENSESVTETPATATGTVSKGILNDMTSYEVYMRSNRHLWTKAITTLDYNSLQDSYDVEFSILLVGDLRPDVRDNVINAGDFAGIAGAWGNSELISLFDLNNDDVINAGDPLQAIQNWFTLGDPFFFN